jgi:hypothetical protein
MKTMTKERPILFSGPMEKPGTPICENCFDEAKDVSRER